MSRYAVSVFAISLLPERGGRLLVPEPRVVPTLKAARTWLRMSRATWTAALLPSERGFIGVVLDEDGSEALTVEYGADPDAVPEEHDRDSLKEMKAARPRATTTMITNGGQTS